MKREWGSRPDPEFLLRQNFPNSSNKGRGKLKIFFGYVADVGKTFAMLEATHQEKIEGRGVAMGYIEPHDRPDTLAFSDGLELLTPKYMEYEGITLRGFDLDGVLIRHPDLVLVGELVHTNAQGCRHKKRYQGVVELLSAGINVYTTVNAQHLEGLRDIAASITHVWVDERIPDRVFDSAAQMKLVDIGPEELRQRLEEEEIYHREQADRTSISFFTAQNLSALHEIALRCAADRVNREMIRERDVAREDYFTGEHVLVCLSPSPTNVKVIRATARTASTFRADFTVVLVETERLKKERVRISRSMGTNINLAEQFRTNVITLYRDDIVEQVASYARQNGISKIIIGRTIRTRHNISAKPALIDRLTRTVPNTDIYMIPDASARERRRNGGAEQERRVGSDLLKTALVMTFCTTMSLILDHYQLEITNVAIIYMMGIILSAYPIRAGWCGLLASMTSVLLFNFFFIEPRYTLWANAFIYPFTFAAMLACALVTSSMASRLKRETAKEETESRYMQILFDINRSLRRGSAGEEILDICGTLVRNLLKRNIVAYDTREGRTNRMKIYPASENEDSTRLTSLFKQQSEAAVVFWVYRDRHKAGATTDTLPETQAHYTPVYKDDRVYAAIGVRMKGGDTIQPNDENVLSIIAKETSYRLGDMKEECPRWTEGARPCRPGIVFVLNLCGVPSDTWNLYDHMQYP